MQIFCQFEVYRLSCYQLSRPFESWIPGEALSTLNKLFSRHF